MARKSIAETLARARAITGKTNPYDGPPPLAVPQGGATVRAPGKVVQAPYKESETVLKGPQQTETTSETSLRPQEDVDRLMGLMNDEKLTGMRFMARDLGKDRRLDDAMTSRFQPRVNLQQLGQAIDSIYGSNYAKGLPKSPDGMALIGELKDSLAKRLQANQNYSQLQLRLGELFTAGPKNVFAVQSPQVVRGEKTGEKPVAIPGGSSGGGPKPPKLDLPGLDKAIKPLEEMLSTLEGIDAELKQAGLPSIRNLREGTDLPGFGPVDSFKEMVGRSTGLFSNDVAIAQMKAKMRNAILQARSGAAVTEWEAKRLMGELGAATNEKSIIRAVKEVYRSLQNGTRARFDARPAELEYYRNTATGKRLLNFAR